MVKTILLQLTSRQTIKKTTSTGEDVFFIKNPNLYIERGQKMNTISK